MKRATLKDLARLLNLSPSTISRALSGHPDISDATKQRVRDAAEAVNYIPNFRARYLRAQHSRLIALVVPEMNMFFVPSLITGINRVLHQHDYSLLIFQSDESVVQERKLVQLCLNLSLDGVLLARSSETTDLSHLDALQRAEIPAVLLDKILDTGTHSTVALDDVQASRDATAYLLERGHRAIIGLFGDERQRISALRRQGFTDAFASHGASQTGALAIHVPFLKNFDEAFNSALDANPDATAVFAMSDELLVRAHHTLAARGLAIPTVVSLLAISDGYAPYFLHPNVTHLLHSGSDVGAQAARVLLSLMPTGSDAAVAAGSVLDVKVRAELVELDSVGEA